MLLVYFLAAFKLNFNYYNIQARTRRVIPAAAIPISLVDGRQQQANIPIFNQQPRQNIPVIQQQPVALPPLVQPMQPLFHPILNNLENYQQLQHAPINNNQPNP